MDFVSYFYPVKIMCFLFIYFLILYTFQRCPQFFKGAAKTCTVGTIHVQRVKHEFENLSRFFLLLLLKTCFSAFSSATLSLPKYSNSVLDMIYFNTTNLNIQGCCYILKRREYMFCRSSFIFLAHAQRVQWYELLSIFREQQMLHSFSFYSMEQKPIS